MVIEHLTWALPASRELYKSRDEILSIWQRIASGLLGKRINLAFTGIAGVGKTVLFDHLSGKAFQQGYLPPGTSQTNESGKVPARGHRIRVSVVPGQDRSPRREGLDQLFLKSKRKAVDGVVHVVSNGFVEMRSPEARAQLIEEGLGTLKKYRARQLKDEIIDLEETCDLIRWGIQKYRKPAWLLVAVTKVDLYYTDIAQAERYYSPHGKGEFVERLQKLQSQVGSDNFRWDALPVCAWLEDFEWNNKRQSSILKPVERDHYVAAFAKRLEQYCES